MCSANERTSLHSGLLVTVLAVVAAAGCSGPKGDAIVIIREEGVSGAGQ